MQDILPTLLEKSAVTYKNYCDSCDSGSFAFDRNPCLDINATVTVKGVYTPVTISLCKICFLVLKSKFMEKN